MSPQPDTQGKASLKSCSSFITQHVLRGHKVLKREPQFSTVVLGLVIACSLAFRQIFSSKCRAVVAEVRLSLLFLITKCGCVCYSVAYALCKMRLIGQWTAAESRNLKQINKKVKVLYWSCIQRTVKFGLCIQPIPEEQWATMTQHPGTNSRF